jgi:methionyl-tRNA synthetase
MEGIVNFDDWQKINLIVGKILNVEEIIGADKLWKLTIDIGECKRTICAGIKKFYSREELLDKKIILFKNLTPRTMKGIESQGMLLAAINSDESKVVLISPEKDIEVGSIIR